MKFDFNIKMDYEEVARKMDDERLGVYCDNEDEAKVLLKALIESGYQWDYQDKYGDHENDWRYTNYCCDRVYSICCGHIYNITGSNYEKSIYTPNPGQLIHFRNIV